MKQIMSYKIISGRTVEEKRTRLSVRYPGEPKKKRRPRVAGSSDLKKIKRNEISSVRNLARVINSTFRAGDLHVCLKYDNDRLPGRDADHKLGVYEMAQKDLARFLRKLRTEYKKTYGRNPKMVWVTGNWSLRTGEYTRMHHHLVIEQDALELIHRLWHGAATGRPAWVRYLDDRADHSNLAAYLVANVHDIPDAKKWHTSRNVDRPIYTEPEPVDDMEGIQPEKGAVIMECGNMVDEDGNITSTYMRYTLPVAPKVRGGKIVMPKPPKRGGKKRE